MLKALGKSLNHWLGIAVQSSCPLCQRSTAQSFCLDCQRQIQRCRSSSWPVEPGIPIIAWGDYSGSLKRAIAAMKYDNQPNLAVPLGQWMAQAWRDSNSASRAIVVPIPMHPEKQQQRGFNQAALLAKSFCTATRLPLQIDGLQRTRATAAQFRLSNAARQQNLKDAFVLGEAFLKHHPAQPVLLLDDIYTTGATIDAAAQTLRRHGIRVQGVIVLARTVLDRRNPNLRF